MLEKFETCAPVMALSDRTQNVGSVSGLLSCKPRGRGSGAAILFQSDIGRLGTS
jgi:hypothetical protein